MNQILIDVSFWWVGFLTYAPFHALHVWVWRNKPPRHEVLELCLYLLLLPTALWLLWTGLQWGPTLSLGGIVLHWLIAANYIAIYPAFQASSPTVHLLCLLARNPKGLSEAEVTKRLSQATAIQDRLEDLQQSQLLIADGGRFRLSAGGKLIALFFAGFRKFLGLKRGAG